MPPGKLIRLLRANGFEIEDLIEILAPDNATENRHEYIALEWAKVAQRDLARQKIRLRADGTAISRRQKAPAARA